uniref:Uncharacterized protein n=1 Tax=Mycena chlorophos TaxID=658473 RepID=A0ABQ0LXB1_MYCCL|nr:predicted protein [Mycena chlorophos]
MAATTPTAFISGPLEPTPEFFTTHYTPRLSSAIAAGHAFIIGPSRGTDALALSHLLQAGVAPTRITVFLRESETRWGARFRRMGVKVVVAGRSHTDRDAAMTAASDYDILRYLTEVEARALYGDKYRPRVSGTEKNEIRRRELVAATRVSGES